MKFLGRYKVVNGGLLFVQRRALLNPFVLVGYCLSKGALLVTFLLSPELRKRYRYPEFAWVDYSCINNRIFLIDKKLNTLCEQAEKLIKERQAVDEMIKKTIKDVDKESLAMRGFSDPLIINVKDLGPIGLDFNPVDQNWKKFIRDHVYGGQRKTAASKVPPPTGTSTSSKVNGGTTSRYVPKSFEGLKGPLEEMASSDGIDSTIMYDKDRGKSSKSQGFNPNNRKRQKNETPEAHSRRLLAIDNGEDMSGWQLND